MKNIAIFASGTGTNARKIIEHFKSSTIAKVVLIACNKPGAGVLDIAKNQNISTIILDKEEFFRGTAYLPELKKMGVDFIVLAGFLWKVPSRLIAAFPDRIINIHPALLPKYGGKGMYGQKVHESVIEAGDKESGISIHYVDDIYDNGKMILQVSCPVLPGESAGSLAKKIQSLEHAHYPQVIESLLTKI
jgi:phosphoribosylglycinamide formyltransferase-1